ncbi:hypothetical protein [Motilimonas eburnea]|uniref:hypothetical protein n=1 Tax=Motilimonas eburnea TaxID=1737488 RepID=UPI001E532224|nr:hypothetical protein [Motilimonas eburnea]MCE2571781.1 hypothetical protein [Motilimonas eburnea]
MLIKSVVFVVALLCSFGSYAKQSEAELVDSLDRYLASIQFHVYEQKIGVSKNGVTEVVFNIKFSSSVSPNDLITPLFESYMSGGMYITKPQKQRVESFNYKQRQALARKGKPMPLHQPSAVELAIPVSLLDFEEPVKASFGVFTDTCLNQNIDLANVWFTDTASAGFTKDAFDLTCVFLSRYPAADVSLFGSTQTVTLGYNEKNQYKEVAFLVPTSMVKGTDLVSRLEVNPFYYSPN